jgi:branched-chain amino acid transport system permease protein
VAVYGWLAAGEGRRDTLAFFLINVALAVALQSFSGTSGILSFGQMAFVGVGAYTASILTIDPLLKPTLLTGLPGFLDSASLPVWQATLVATVVCGVLAAFLGLPVLRLAGAAAVIATLALLLAADVVFSAWLGVTRGSGGLYAIPEGATLGATLVLAVGAVVAARLFADSRLGRQLQASREDPLAAASLGIAVRRCRLAAWILSGALSGAAGAMLAFWLGTISPANFFLAPTFTVIVMMIVGGMGTVAGAVTGAGIVTLVQEVLRRHEDTGFDFGPLHVERLTGMSQIALVALILAVMYLRPEGIVARREPDEALRLGLASLRARRSGSEAVEPADCEAGSQLARDPGV